MKINRLFLFVFLLSFSCAALAFMGGAVRAQEVAPGDPCTAGEINRYLLSGGPELSGAGHLMTCNGANWIKVFSFDTTGVLQPQFTNTGACGDGDTLVYSSATGGITCNTACSDNTPNPFNFTDNVNALPSTLTASNILQITSIACQVNVNISGEGAPQYRTCTDSACLTLIQDWTNISTGINNNEYVQMRLTTSPVGGNTFTANLVVGNTIDLWNVTPTGSCVGGPPPPGTVCADGTIYAGQSPDGNLPMYTSRCDEGMSWNGTVCTGLRVLLPWNNGGNPVTPVFVGAGSSLAGQANTAILNGADADSGTPGIQLHRAPQRCADLNLNGHIDWYLPAFQEASVLSLNQAAIGNFSLSPARYWTSWEKTASSALSIVIPGPGSVQPPKSEAQKVRCVRR